MMTVRRSLTLLLILLMVLSMVFSIAEKIQDPYAAYNLDQNDSEINYRMVNNPPEVVIIKPVFLEYDGQVVPISKGEMRFALGGASNTLTISEKIIDQNNSALYSAVDATLTISYVVDGSGRFDLPFKQQTAYSQLVYREPYNDYVTMDSLETDDYYGTFSSAPYQYPDDEGTYIVFTLQKNRDSYRSNMSAVIYCQIVGVIREGAELTESVVTNDAEETAGETGIDVSSDIVIQKPKVKDGTATQNDDPVDGADVAVGVGVTAVATALGVATAGVAGVAGGGAGIGGAGGTSSGSSGSQPGNKRREDEEESPEDSTYQMRIMKDFGNKIKYDGSPVFVYCRMVEITASGVEKERLDLTARMEIFSESGPIQVLNTQLSGSYMGATIQAESAGFKGVKEGTISFRFNGDGGFLQNNVVFQLAEEPFIRTLGKHEETVYALAGDQKTYDLPFEGVDFLQTPQYKLGILSDGAPFEVEIGQDMAGRPILKVQNTSDKVEPIKAFYDHYQVELIAENEKEFARAWIRLIVCHEGLIGKFDGDKAEIKAYYDDEIKGMPSTRVRFQLGLWNETTESLELLLPNKLEATLSDERRIFDNIGLKMEEDRDSQTTDSLFYQIKVDCPFPSLNEYAGSMKAMCERNNQWFEWESKITLIPDVQQYTKDCQLEYERCLYIIDTYLPEDWQSRKRTELEKARVLFGVEDYIAYRKKVWFYAERLILEEQQSYLKHSYAADEAIAYLEIYVYIGDTAFEIALLPLGGPLASLLVKQTKNIILKLIEMQVEKGRIDFDEMVEYTIKDMLGGLDDFTVMPKPNERRKLVVWLAGFFIYRFSWHLMYSKDDDGKLIGVTASLEKAAMDLSSKAIVGMMGNFMDKVAANSGVAKNLKKVYNKDADAQLSKSVTDATGNVLNEADTFVGEVIEEKLGKEAVDKVVAGMEAIENAPAQLAKIISDFMDFVKSGQW